MNLTCPEGLKPPAICLCFYTLAVPKRDLGTGQVAHVWDFSDGKTLFQPDFFYITPRNQKWLLPRQLLFLGEGSKTHAYTHTHKNSQSYFCHWVLTVTGQTGATMASCWSIPFSMIKFRRPHFRCSTLMILRGTAPTFFVNKTTFCDLHPSIFP